MIPLLVFGFSYVAFALGRVPGLRSDRLGAAVVGAALMIAFGGLTLEEAQAAIDGGTIALLFGMMVLSAALEISGAFAMIAWWLTRRTPSPLALLGAVCVSSALLSAFLINDVVCIALTPIVLHVTAELDCDPRPYLIGLATSSNIGSVATITGNPQNILIGSLARMPYSHFAAALAPVSVLALVANLVVLRLAYRRSLSEPFAARRQVPRPRVYRRWVWKGAVVTLGVLVAFAAGAPPPIAALMGASLILLTRAVDPKRVYVRIDWTLLALFAGLFVVVAGVERVGLAQHLLAALSFARPDTVGGLTLTTALLSNIVSNVPAVMVLKSLVPHLPDQDKAWLTLAMSSTLAGNLTLPGSLATLIVVERARSRVHISFWEFAKVGFPAAILSLAIGAAWLGYVAG